ncbi:DNA primase [Prevotella sp.]|uniref:DNA primase n=1 Tax=Prevotella sp. TaxID=59823 RepID=UPI002A8208EE|nr:DNA primase [Prevotella sp.]MDY4645118.1 DNA primase [Prevotella sp.]
MIRQEIIDTILDRTDIVQVIAQHVQLKKSGIRYVGCCPFHQEKTPSFYVFPHTGTFKCFGCGEGGDAIHFIEKAENKTFVEAVRTLAQKANVQIEEQEESVEEKQKRMHREALWITNKQVADFYRKQFLDSKEAQEYAYRRWGKDYCTMQEIGYAPKDGHAMQQLPVKAEFLKELGLLNRGGYDFYQNRVVIQIHDRFGHVIGFTARCMDDQQPKYLNSSESDIFHKSYVLFGIEDAWKTAAKQDKMFLVEGAPDCMRLQSIGIHNTVAALGSAWNDSHFSTIKRVTNKVCFLPDADPPKKGETHGHGVQVVMEAGTQAMEYGLTVSVKEIPDTEENIKQDPDSFFKNTNIFNATEEVDFILWMADKLFPHTTTTEEQREAIKEIAYLLSLIDDETGVSMYIGKLTKYYQGKRLWLKAVDEERKKREQETKTTKDKEENDLNRKYGFYVDHGCYMSITEKGSVYEWSNFTMLPLFHIKDTTNPKRLYKIKNAMNQEEILELKQEDLIALAKFKQKIEGLGNFIWKGTEKELTKLKSYLYEKTETATEITQMGWQRAGFYAFGNGVFYDDLFIKTDDYGIVRLKDKGNYYLPSCSTIYKSDTKLFTFEKQFVHLNLSSVTLKEFTDQLFKVYGDNGRVGFCFYLATLFRDVVTTTSANHWFLILNLFGPKGSGKSELGHTLLSLFTISYTAPNIQNSTPSALNDTVAQSANALAHIDEYKNDIDPKMIEFLKGLWDGTGRTRMNMDLDKKKETTAVDSGIILSGQEMPTSDIALFSRLIFLQFPRSEFSDLEKQNYKKLLEMRSLGLTHLTLEVLKQRKHFEQAWSTAFHETQTIVANALGREKGEDRIMNNWCVPLAALRVLQGIIPTLTYDDMLRVTIEGIKKQNGECKTNGELGTFWYVVQYLASEGDLIEGGDFFIRFYSKFKTDIINAIWQSERPVLFLQKSRIFSLYRKEGRQANEKVLPTDALKYYLQNSKAYLGEKVARFDVYKKGILQYDHAKMGANNSAPKLTTTQRAYCFDYALLCETFGISLWASSDQEDCEE